MVVGVWFNIRPLGGVKSPLISNNFAPPFKSWIDEIKSEETDFVFHMFILLFKRIIDSLRQQRTTWRPRLWQLGRDDGSNHWKKKREKGAGENEKKKISGQVIYHFGPT